MASADSTTIETVLRHDRFVVIGGLVTAIAIAWAWVILGAGIGVDAPASMPMAGMPGMAAMMMESPPWTPGYAGVIFAMWWLMMTAMMLPGAAPTLLLFARMNRKDKAGGRPYVPTATFAAGYLAVWGAFSALATGLQWELERGGLLSPMMATTSVWLGSAILIAAGIWQLTPVKNICLRHCRSPMSALVQHWQPGRTGAWRMGLVHGTNCLGCCWFLMGLLFFGGVMNLYWIAGLAGFILIEKTVPMGHWFGRISGAGLAAWGVAMLLLATTGP
jgi:predicted metal-binding membrane protein